MRCARCLERAIRALAEEALWLMARAGEADCSQDERYRALVLLAAFARLRWGEVTALRRSDVDLKAGVVRVRAAFAERSTGEIVLGPPKPRAGRRVVGIPGVILPALAEHLSVFSAPGPDGLVFPGPKGGPLRRGNFNRQAVWPRAVAAVGVKRLHFMTCGIAAMPGRLRAVPGCGTRWPGWGTTASAPRSSTSIRRGEPTP